jgi:eukaryotic-like serine/threonine-protein kinase
LMLTFDPFTFDRVNGLLRKGTREIPLPPRVLAVLDILVSRAGAIVPKQEIIDTVWRDAFVTDTSLAEAISVLRQALDDDPQSPQYIQTVHRRGYRFVAPVTALPAILTEARAPASSGVEDDRTAPSISHHFLPWGIAGLCAVLAAIAVWQYTHFRAPIVPLVRMRIEPATGTVFDRRAPALALSPDGLTLAWSACDSSCRLYVRALDQLDPQPVAATDDASAPFFSPDGRWIGFFGTGKLRKVAVAGGMPVVVAEASQPFGAVWLPDGHIIFAASARGGLMRVNDSGGDIEQLTLPAADGGEVRHCWPALAPGGRALLFTVATSPQDESSGRIAIMPLSQPSVWQTILENADTARAGSQDYIAFSRGTEIHAVAFDRARQAIAGTDQTVVGNVARAQFALGASGAVVYAIGGDDVKPSLTWIPTGGAPVSGDLAAFQDLVATPDGSRVAGVSGSDLWVGDVSRGTTTRLTHGGTNVGPVWSGNGSSVYYAVRNGGPFEAWSRESSGTAPAKLALSAGARHRHVFPTSISRDGNLMAYVESGGATRGDVKVASLSNGATIAAIETPFDETNGALSPDGRVLAYQSDESGRWEVSLLKLDDRQRIPVSSSGGSEPMWSGTGNSLVYRTANAVMRVMIDGSGHPVGAPITIAMPSAAVVVGISGDRMLARVGGEVPAVHAVLTLEWARELQRILGPPTTTLPR